MIKVFFIVGWVLWLGGCDFFAKRRCEWFIMPQEKDLPDIEEGFAMVCIRNFELVRQRCFLKMDLKEAIKVYGKPMRYVDIEVNREKFPKTIESVKVCKE